MCVEELSTCTSHTMHVQSVAFEQTIPDALKVGLFRNQLSNINFKSKISFLKLSYNLA